jgi:hypothetical protein
MATQALSSPRTDETARIAIARADRGSGPMTVSVADWCVAKYGEGWLRLLLAWGKR